MTLLSTSCASRSGAAWPPVWALSDRPVTVHVQGEGGTWRDFDDWPPPATLYSWSCSTLLGTANAPHSAPAARSPFMPSVSAVAPCPGCRLQRVRQAADRIPFDRMIQVAQGAEDSLGQQAGAVALRLVEEQVILAGAILHARKADQAAHVGLQSLVE